MIILTIINTIAIATFYLLLFIAQNNITKKNKGATKYANFKKRKNNQEN